MTRLSWSYLSHRQRNRWPFNPLIVPATVLVVGQSMSVCRSVSLERARPPDVRRWTHGDAKARQGRIVRAAVRIVLGGMLGRISGGHAGGVGWTGFGGESPRSAPRREARPKP